MAKGIFDPDHDLWRLTGKLVDLIVLSVFWLVCSLPVFTLGPSTAALYRTVVRCIRGDERNSWSMFFLTFRDNFKVGALTSLITVAVGAVLFFLCYLFPVLSRFDFGVGGLLSTCAKLAIAHLPSTVAMALLLYGALFVCINFFVSVAVLPALLALVHSFFLERIFAPFVREQLGEDDDPDEES